MENLPADRRSDFRRFPKEAIEQSVPARFEEQVRRHPRRLAVAAGAMAVSYEELDERANRIAGALLDRAGEAEEPIALLLETGIGFVAAMLGALKAGKAFVPLDPAAPSARSARSFAESSARLVVTRRAHVAAHSWQPEPRHVIAIDGLRAGAAAVRPALPLSAARLADVFYTSGSTGEPKGVADSHRNLLHNVLRYTNGLAIAPDDRLSLLQSPASAAASRTSSAP